MDAVLEYSKVNITIQSYVKAQSYAKATGTPSEPKDTKWDRSHAATSATVSSTSEEVPGLKTNDDGTFTLDGRFYWFKVFVLEDIGKKNF